KISVTTTGGSTNSANAFTVTLKPVVTNFFPEFGVPGTTVTIEGVNFLNTIGVGFSGRPASWRLVAAHQISATVPFDATNSGPITVTNPSGTGTNAQNFVVTRAPIINSFTPFVAGAGAQVFVAGANLSNGPTVLKFNGVSAAFVVTGQNGTLVQATVPTGARTGPITMTNAF